MSIEVGVIRWGANGPGSLIIPLQSRIMVPNGDHHLQLELDASPHRPTGGLELALVLRVDGIRQPLLNRVFPPDELADAYEKTHHLLHGYDARGLDPREGPTRLRP